MATNVQIFTAGVGTTWTRPTLGSGNGLVRGLLIGGAGK